MLRERALGVVAATLAVALLGCPPQDDQGSQRGGAEAYEGLMPPEILGVARTIHTSEIEQAQAVMARIDDMQVKAFIEELVADHQRGLEGLEELSTNMAIVPEQSELATDLNQEFRERMGELKDATGPDLTSEFVENQVQLHERALEVVDEKLLPAATAMPLQSYINEMRGMLQNHLQVAKRLQQQIESEPDQGRPGGAR